MNPGMYSIDNVLAGTYQLKVTAAGFRPFVETNLAVTINNVARVNMKLEVGGTTEQVTVEASAALLQSDKADVHVELNAKEVTDLPLANYRNYQSLINLVPGATPGISRTACWALRRGRWRRTSTAPTGTTTSRGWMAQ